MLRFFANSSFAYRLYVRRNFLKKSCGTMLSYFKCASDVATRVASDLCVKDESSIVT